MDNGKISEKTLKQYLARKVYGDWEIGLLEDTRRLLFGGFLGKPMKLSVPEVTAFYYYHVYNPELGREVLRVGGPLNLALRIRDIQWKVLDGFKAREENYLCNEGMVSDGIVHNMLSEAGLRQYSFSE